MVISSWQERARTPHWNQSQSTFGSTRKRSSIKPNSALLQSSILGKRVRENSSETSRNGDKAVVKRPRKSLLASYNQLCDECSELRWNLIDTSMSFEGRVDWQGMTIVYNVGTRYRNVPPSTACTLCHQLHAPWIESFLRDRNPTPRKANDVGDRIQIFRYLRHLPHVNDYQTSRNALREHNAPYHIAVVPKVGGWRKEIREHIEEKGMVVVIPEGPSKSELFVPQHVSRKFHPNVVKSYLEFCKSHKKRCNPKAPEVEGMKLIDCNSEDLVIRACGTGDKYVALSYVWGKQNPRETPAFALARKGTLHNGNITKAKPKQLQLVVRTPQYVSRPRLDTIHKEFVPNQAVTMTAKTLNRTTAASRDKAASRLPKNVPQTIQDAIWVTKALGYRYLWVDKYCIDQSNEKEKQQQCGRMGDIYARSQITIFALGPDSNYGLPGVSSRLRLRHRQCTTVERYKFVSTMPDPHRAIKQSTWSTRGWTYQEGLFSTRRLFFTDNQVYFECNAMNCVESFESNLKYLHTQNGQRFRAYHRAGKFVCGNSNQYSHLDVTQNEANHRKVDTIRRCQYQISEYSNRELTNKDDVLNAFAGVAHFYARTTAKILSLAGIPIPFPIAKLRDTTQERLNHLSYALAWTHEIHDLTGSRRKSFTNQSEPVREQLPWSPSNSVKPQRREGFPSWSWAGWFGKISSRVDLPYCWTSCLSSVRIGFRTGDVEDYAWLNRYINYKQYLVRKLLTATVLHFDAYVLDPKKLNLGTRDPRIPHRFIPLDSIQIYLSMGACSLEELQHKLIDKEFECLVIGTYGEPRKDIFKAIQAADVKRSDARNRRIDLFERVDPDAIICLIVHTVNGISYRMGLLKVEIGAIGMERTLEAWNLGIKRRFMFE